MKLPIADYKTLVFDCDGVILNSNSVKTQAFYDVASHYGEAEARAFVEYHKANGGVSRYAKFTYFLNDILGKYSKAEYENLLQQYADQVSKALLVCEVSSGLAPIREATTSQWLVVSGSDQAELRSLFSRRALEGYFEKGVFGSPDTKEIILSREMPESPALFIGDSKYDYQAASAAGLDFVFMTEWSDVENCVTWCEEEGVPYSRNLQTLLGKTIV